MNMKDFQHYLNEAKEYLMEKLITFGGKAYPRNNQVLILAGGAGSGKGWVLKNLVGLEGKTINVDDFKDFLLKSRTGKEYSQGEIDKLDLKNPDDVGRLHQWAKDLNLEDKMIDALMKGTPAEKVLKPNLIFDVTLKDAKKLDEINRIVSAMGYQKEDIHLVWVLNDIEIALQQNAKRSRTVAPAIVKATHYGVAGLMKEVFKGKIDLQKYLDGDFYIALNRRGVDTAVAKSALPKHTKGVRSKDKPTAGSYVSDADYFHVKKKGKKINLKSLSKDAQQKIDALMGKAFKAGND